MNHFKMYIINVIAVSAVIQLSGIIITKESYKKLFRLISAILIIFAFITFPVPKDSVDININNVNPDNIQLESINYNDVMTSFAEKVSSKICKDIETNLGYDCKVDVVCDEEFNNLKINVCGAFDNATGELIKEYVYNNYCTNNDEVIVENESN